MIPHRFFTLARKIIAYGAVVAILGASGCAHSAEMQKSPIDQDKTPVIISIDAKGNVYVQDQPVMLEDLVPKLKTITKAHTEERIFLRGDKEASYGRVMETMGLANAGGFKNISLVANTPTSNIAKESSTHLMTMSEVDNLDRQISTCWNVPVGSLDAKNMSVELSVDVNPDRTVQNVAIVDKDRYDRDRFFHSVADSVVRALHNPRCSPLELPAGKYDQWKHMTLNLDVGDLL